MSAATRITCHNCLSNDCGERSEIAPFPNIRRRDRDSSRLDELAEPCRGIRPYCSVPRNDQRPLGFFEERLGSLKQFRVRRRESDTLTRVHRGGVGLRPGDVLGEFEVGRAGFLVFGEFERLPDGFGDDVGVCDLCVPLRDRLEQLDDVQRLVALLTLHASPPLSSIRRCLLQPLIPRFGLTWLPAHYPHDGGMNDEHFRTPTPEAYAASDVERCDEVPEYPVTVGFAEETHDPASGSPWRGCASDGSKAEWVLVRPDRTPYGCRTA